MKTKNILTIGALAVALFFSSCSKNENQDPNDGSKTASLKITIAGERTQSKGVTEPTQVEENKIFNYTVYVLNAATNNVQHVEPVSSTLTSTYYWSKKDRCSSESSRLYPHSRCGG